MTSKTQFITDNSRKKIAVILPITSYEKMMADLEELEDIRLYDKTKQEDKGSRVSFDDYLNKRKLKNA
ncbi:hypothetical protein [Runella sp.]|uniref:hypothetical protein n=1 Tax=Runella sp. TaxID=1960881 RepID=UPI0026130163|nr:hypothetical protein [Runella sp.]